MGLLHAIDELSYQFIKIPWLVYLIFCCCIIYGWWARYSRVISYRRVLLFPILLGLWSLHSVFARYSTSFGHLTVWTIFLIIGCIIGWLATIHNHTQADKEKKLIKIPGSPSMLIWILLIFIFRYYFGFIHTFHPESLKSAFYTYPDIIISAMLIGIILGRGLHYTYAYLEAPHTPLQRTIKM
jgi:hypothetical protein